MKSETRLYDLADRLGQELPRLRSTAGLSGDRLATTVGISQAKVSRIETDVTARPAMDVIARWLDDGHRPHPQTGSPHQPTSSEITTAEHQRAREATTRCPSSRRCRSPSRRSRAPPRALLIFRTTHISGQSAPSRAGRFSTHTTGRT
ncbi:helix-turn-helix domain-containing protein [Kribbella sp. NPDC056951]|uniref:helix-turn-helix domain-containing protein n=1 Tax=Kribbella sp. NPDC056951 TaxID=3345978 RepID=UPI0036303724